MELTEEKREKKNCARLGWALTATIVLAYVWQAVLYGADWLLYDHGVEMSDTVFYLLGLVGNYIVSLPIAYAICRRCPKDMYSPVPLEAKRWVRWFVIGAALMWLGSVVGTAVNALTYSLSGREAVSLVDDTFGAMPVGVVLLGACVLGPLCEELLFRGLIARRLVRYGEKPAAFVSALLFALYHGNLEQFFYAFGIGLLLAYAYFYTGRLRTSVSLHAALNLLGAGLPMLFDSDGFAVLYGALWLVFTAAGVILMVRGRKTQQWRHGPCEPSMRVVFGNAGMTMAIIACFVETAVTFVLS